MTESRPGVLTILITTGYGAGLRLTIQHCAIAEGIAVGSVVKYGDTIAWTARELMPPITQTDASPTAVGVFGRTGSYHPDQEMMIIGLDGEYSIREVMATAIEVAAQQAVAADRAPRGGPLHLMVML